MIILYYLLYSFLCLYTLWVFYLAVMNLKRARDANELTGVAKLFGTPVLLVGLVIDAVADWTVCTALFLELPKEKTVTSRLKRHINSEGWRSNIAAWICMNLLNKFDPSGNHCK